MTLSSPLASLLGETTVRTCSLLPPTRGKKRGKQKRQQPQLSRPQTVKKIWEYVRSQGLQNPDDKRQIVCDEPMKAVFKQDTVHMFTMVSFSASPVLLPDP